jgi:protein subunit release factor A
MLDKDEKDIRIDFFRASGPGGQHRNKSETGVRLTHLPTGIVVTATESRSRHLNLKHAFARLEARLAARNRPVIPRVPTRPGKAAVKRRLEEKRRQSERKQNRSHPAE